MWEKNSIFDFSAGWRRQMLPHSKSVSFKTYVDKTLLWCRSITCRRGGCFTTHRFITIIYNSVGKCQHYLGPWAHSCVFLLKNKIRSLLESVFSCSVLMDHDQALGVFFEDWISNHQHPSSSLSVVNRILITEPGPRPASHCLQLKPHQTNEQ